MLCFSMSLEAQKISFKTASSSYTRSMMFELKSNQDNQVIKIKWGDIEKTYSIGKKKTIIDSEIDIKPSTTVVIEGNVTGLSLSDARFEYLDVTQNPSLVSLEISNNGLKKIDLTKNVNLENLDMNSNEISIVNLNANKKLKTLNLAACMIDELSIEQCSDLKILNIAYNSLEKLVLHPDVRLSFFKATSNKITNLDFSNQTDLETFIYDSGRLQELDLSNATKLQRLDVAFSKSLQGIKLPSKAANLNYLNVSECALNKLDVADFPSLTILNCSNNKIDKLNLSKNSSLKELYCSMNKLTSLDISNNQHLKEVFCANNNLSSQALDEIYKALPKLKTRPQNPNLFVGGTNKFVGAKSYIAELKNWYPTDKGNGGGGNPTAFFSNIGGNNNKEIYEVKIEIEALSETSTISYDCGNGDNIPVQLKNGKASLDITSNGNLIIMGNVKSIKIDGLGIYTADLTSLTTIQNLDLAKSNVRDLQLADGSALKRLVVSDCQNMTYLLLKSQPQLNYLDIRNCSLTASTMNAVFAALPKLSEKSQTPNLLIAGNKDNNEANYTEAYNKNWNFDIPASSEDIMSDHVLFSVYNHGFIVNSDNLSHVNVYNIDGHLVFSQHGGDMKQVMIEVFERGAYIVNIIFKNGKQITKKINL